MKGFHIPQQTYDFALDATASDWWTSASCTSRDRFYDAMRIYRDRFGQFAPESMYRIIWNQANHVSEFQEL